MISSCSQKFQRLGTRLLWSKMAQWEEFFDEVISFIRITLAREVAESDDAVLKLDNYIRILSAINDTLNADLELASLALFQ